MRLALIAIGAIGCGGVAIDVASPAAITAADVAPLFELTSHDGRTLRLHDALANGPVVLVFYRGHW